ncbi:MAG: MerR family transcriptional regulator [Candidatus Omnitrophica bacterium]|nr:MerR family transcriptional regulator [Candidatus Omnitrophota bacterium]
MSKKLILSKDIVQKYNIPYSTLTHYTDMGLLQVVKKSGNRRMYDEGEVRVQLEKILELVDKGYPLRLIRDLLINGQNHDPGEGLDS